MGEDKHWRNFVSWQMQQPGEYQQTHCFVTAYLPRRSRQDEKHVIDSIPKDHCSKGDGQSDRPESKHGEETITGHSQVGECPCQHEYAWTASASHERVCAATCVSFALPLQVV